MLEIIHEINHLLEEKEARLNDLWQQLARQMIFGNESIHAIQGLLRNIYRS